jgi:hypothetical protein
MMSINMYHLGPSNPNDADVNSDNGRFKSLDSSEPIGIELMKKKKDLNTTLDIPQTIVPEAHFMESEV